VLLPHHYVFYVAVINHSKLVNTKFMWLPWHKIHTSLHVNWSNCSEVAMGRVCVCVCVRVCACTHTHTHTLHGDLINLSQWTKGQIKLSKWLAHFQVLTPESVKVSGYMKEQTNGAWKTVHNQLYCALAF